MSSYHRLSDQKFSQFKEDIKDEKNFEKKLTYLIKNEYDTTLNDILQLEPDAFIDRIYKGISFSLENLYTENCLSNKKLIEIIDKLINIKKNEYSTIIQILKDTFNNYEKVLKRKPHKDSLLSNFRKHCFHTDNYARHNCGSSNNNFILVKNKDNKINYVICESCKKVYYSSYILCSCNHCNVDYYSGVLTEEENPNFLVATWENYHCPQITNEKMKCIKCRGLFYLDMKNGNLTCLNKKCGFVSKPSSILWICSFCQEEFKSNAIPYNPLYIQVVRKAIKQTLLLKHRAHPNKMPCCKLNVFFTEFFHKKTCKGILYEGELNDNMIVVCDKCQAINLYERFIWTCPQCLQKFKDKDENNDNININNSKKKNNINCSIEKKSTIEENGRNNNFSNNNKLIKRKEKCRSVCKDDANNRHLEKYNERYKLKEKEINVGINSNIKREDKTKELINNIDEKKEIKKYDLKLRYESPKRNNKKDNNLSKFINSRIESQKEKCFKIILKNDVVENNSDNKNNIKNQNNINLYNNNFFYKSCNNIDYKNNIKRFVNEKNKEFQLDSTQKSRNEEKKQENNEKISNLNQKRSNVSYEQIPRNNNKRYYFNNRFKEENKQENNKEENIKKIVQENKISPVINNNINIKSNNYIRNNNSISNSINNSINNINNNINNNVKNNIKISISNSNNNSINNINNNIKNNNSNNNSINNNKNIPKSDGVQKKDRFLRRNISVGNLNMKKEIPKNNNENDIENINIKKRLFDSPKKQNKKARFASVESKKIKENKIEDKYKNENLISRNNILPYNRKLTSEIENMEFEHRKNKMRFHVYFSQSKKNNNEENEKEKENNNENKEDINQNKFQRFGINKKEDNSKSNNDKNEEDREQENKNTTDNSNSKTKESEDKKNYRRYGNNNKEQNKEKIIDLEEKQISNNNKEKDNKNIHQIKVNKQTNLDNNNNDNDNLSSIPEKVGLQNLVGLTDKLLNHLKRRINNIFLKTKIPIFDVEDYKIDRKLGEGSYGIIYSVQKKNDKSSPVYALKKIVAKTITEVCNFIKEFELVYSCNHPNIMKIYGLCLRILDSTTFAIYVLMEKSKYDWDKEIKLHLAKRKIYTEKELIDILKQLTEALLFLKNKFNISHRDIKPQNILIFDDNKYKLADFGEAKEIKISKKLNTLRGTELYMSPALYEGLKRDKNDVSHNTFKSDVFSLGFCFLYAADLNFNLLYKVRDITDNNITEEAINNDLKKKYSNNFIQILIKMLKVDEIKRFGFTEILEYINNNYS